ncbi:hypothetical protein [Streptomyces puniciscabiei]|uniref:hypothetical protein n=1 Tax=Streptomyces puniciscabiei TaxID=164348 RepID=UPI003326BB70
MANTNDGLATFAKHYDVDSSPRPWTWLAIGRPLPSGVRPQVGAPWVGNQGEQVWGTREHWVGKFNEPHHGSVIGETDLDRQSLGGADDQMDGLVEMQRSGTWMGTLVGRVHGASKSGAK